MEDIYIVTSGEYSDYHIVHAFKELKNAEDFCTRHRNCNIEPCPLYDDMSVHTPFNKAWVYGNINDDNPTFSINHYTDEDDFEEYADRTYISFWGKDSTTLTIERLIKDDYDEKQEKERLLKAFRDIATNIKYEISDFPNYDYYKELSNQEEAYDITKDLNLIYAGDDFV